MIIKIVITVMMALSAVLIYIIARFGRKTASYKIPGNVSIERGFNYSMHRGFVWVFSSFLLGLVFMIEYGIHIADVFNASPIMLGIHLVSVATFLNFFLITIIKNGKKSSSHKKYASLAMVTYASVIITGTCMVWM